jgi:hypothetical protein
VIRSDTRQQARGRRRRARGAALAPVLLLLVAAGCSPPPPDLAGAVALVASRLSPRGLERSAFYAVHPEGTPSDFVSFFFSPLGKAEWVPDPSTAPEGVVLVGPDGLLDVGGELPPGGVGLAAEQPDPRLRRQVVLRADDERGVVIAAAYELPGRDPVLVRELALPRVTPAPGVAEMALENLRLGVDAGLH